MFHSLKLLLLSLPLALTLFATPSFALFDAQLLLGKRWYSFDPDHGDKHGVAGQEVTVAAHVDPIPLIPVGAGVYVSMLDLREEDFPSTKDDVSGLEAGIEVTAWIPLVPIVTPYAKLGYPLMSRIVEKFKYPNPINGEDADVVANYKVTGPQIRLGVKYSPLPLVAILLEFGQGMQEAKFDTFDVDGIDKSMLEGKDMKANSQAVLLGVEVGL